MSSLAELPELVGFFSYSREDDEAFKGTLSGLRDGIYRELSAQLGRSKKTFRLWQDQEAIASGKLWESEIKTAIDQSVFFIPIVTPRSVNSKYCKFEFESFLAREKAINRGDLIFPILYISVAALENEAKWRDDPVLSTIGRRQYVDWRSLRHLDVQTTAVREQIERLCRNIVEALNESWVAPEERRRMEEARARQQAEEETRRLEAESKRRAHEEERQRQAEAEAWQQADEERSRLEAETKRRADEAESQGRAEAEARQRADEERRRQEAEAKLRAEQKQAFAAAKHADSVGAIDAFLANHPESRHTSEAQTLRAALVARDEACKRAMASDDPAVLKAFLKTYPKSTPAPQVRQRLRHLEPQKVWPISRRAALIVLSALAATVLLLLLYHAVLAPPTEVVRDTPPPAAAQSKLGDRIEPGSPQTPATPAPTTQAAAPAAQKVVLFEEDPADPNGKRFDGSAIWRTEMVTPGPGQPPELAIRADVEVPERKLAMTWSLRRNTDKGLPATHTVEIMFKLPADFPSGGIYNVPGILMKQAQQTRGTPLAGLAVKVTPGFYLIGLSNAESDKDRNLQLLKERSWFDIPVVYNNNRRAILALEKGPPGERVFAEAFKAWKE
jgi:hypothetical protein